MDFYRAGPAGIRTTKAFSQDCRWPELDLDRAEGCIRSLDNAYSQEGRPGGARRQPRGQRRHRQDRRGG
ncbi:hypothetical protein ACTG11_25665 [Aeromonas hydrophila]